ncbi:MAG TPA: hypothetical protein VKR58_01060 [Aquella sp.]|nr:hypothetical protein [Aquella sp.]
MLSFKKGRPVSKIIGGEYNGEILYVDTENENSGPCCKKCSKKCVKKQCCGGCNMCYENDSDSEEDIGNEIEINDGKLEPLIDVNQRSVNYIAGPSGSGKSTYASNIIKNYKKIFPEKELFIFSRTDSQNDPALVNLGGYQISIDQSLLTDPIDITKELSGGSILLFDDCNTVQDDKLKKAIDKLMADIMEIGRKLDITIIITNHLVIPNEKKIARTIMNEMQCLTVFPKSGSSQQIRYALKQYFGLNNKQIDQILQIPSRWITIHKTYPQTIIYENGAFIL